MQKKLRIPEKIMLQLKTISAKFQDTKSTHKNQLCFSSLTMTNPKRKLRKQSHLLQHQKKKDKILRNKLNKGGKRLIHSKLQNTAKNIKEDTNKWKENN